MLGGVGVAQGNGRRTGVVLQVHPVGDVAGHLAEVSGLVLPLAEAEHERVVDLLAPQRHSDTEHPQLQLGQSQVAAALHRDSCPAPAVRGGHRHHLGKLVQEHGVGLVVEHDGVVLGPSGAPRRYEEGVVGAVVDDRGVTCDPCLTLHHLQVGAAVVLSRHPQDGEDVVDLM